MFRCTEVLSLILSSIYIWNLDGKTGTSKFFSCFFERMCRNKVMWRYCQKTLHNNLFISFDIFLWISCHKFTKKTYCKLKSSNTFWSPMLFFSCHKPGFWYHSICPLLSYLSGISLLNVLNTACFRHCLLCQGEQLWDMHVFTYKLGRVW